jgi:hypothetical protein
VVGWIKNKGLPQSQPQSQSHNHNHNINIKHAKIIHPQHHQPVAAIVIQTARAVPLFVVVSSIALMMMMIIEAGNTVVGVVLTTGTDDNNNTEDFHSIKYNEFHGEFHKLMNIKITTVPAQPPVCCLIFLHHCYQEKLMRVEG